jgi:hypothetical protein
VESAGEIAPEEDPTTSYRGARDRQEPLREQVSSDAPGGADAGRIITERAEGTPEGGETIPGELGEEDGPTTGEVPSSQPAPQASEGSGADQAPSGEEAASDELAEDNDENEEK